MPYKLSFIVPFYQKGKIFQNGIKTLVNNYTISKMLPNIHNQEFENHNSVNHSGSIKILPTDLKLNNNSKYIKKHDKN